MLSVAEESVNNYVFLCFEFSSAQLKYKILIWKHELWTRQKSPRMHFCVTLNFSSLGFLSLGFSFFASLP